MAVRAPHLYQALYCFCLAAFKELGAELERGAALEFDFAEHASHDRPSFHEYRPLVRAHVEARGDRLSRLQDARIAVEELGREPAAAIYARAHAGAKPSEEQALFHTVALPLLLTVANACGGFDWDETAFAKAYAELELSLYGSGHLYAAVAPLVGLSTGGMQVDLGAGIRVRLPAPGELERHWPEARGLLPSGFGQEPERACVIELERDLAAGETEPPDAPAELADAITALRLATAGPAAAGPVLFERLDWQPYGIRPVLPIAATEPGGEPTRLDRFRGPFARDLRERLMLADEDAELGEALDRWELALFQDGPLRSEQLRESLTALLGGQDGPFAACVRVSALLGETGRERADLLARLRTGEPDADTVRRALVEVLMHGDRGRLIERLDETLLGLKPRPPGYFAARAVAG